MSSDYARRLAADLGLEEPPLLSERELRLRELRAEELRLRAELAKTPDPLAEAAAYVEVRQVAPGVKAVIELYSHGADYRAPGQRKGLRTLPVSDLDRSTVELGHAAGRRLRGRFGLSQSLRQGQT